MKPKVSRRKEIKIGAQRNVKETKKTIEKISIKWRSFIFWKYKQNWQTFSQTHQKKKERKRYLIKIRNERRDVIADTTEILRITEPTMDNYASTNWTTKKK